MDWSAQSILDLRHAAGFTQKQLAEWLRVTVKQVKHLENRRRNPSGPVTRLLDILKGQLEGSKSSNESMSPIVMLSSSQRELPQPPKRPSREPAVGGVALPLAVVEVKDLETHSVNTLDSEPSTQDDAFLWQT